MFIDFLSVDQPQLLGDSAMHPIEPLATRPGVLRLLAGRSLLRRPAYPDTQPVAHSGTSN